MNAAQMCAQLQTLMTRYDVVPRPTAVALSASTDGAQVLTGIASTPDVDCERVRFAPKCFGDPLPDNIPLLFEHDATPGSIGRIEDLHYDSRGALLIRCTVVNATARRCNAFSVGARIDAFVMRRADSPHFYAEVTAARLSDISLVSAPINPKCLVTRREGVPPAVEFFDLMTAKVAVLQRLVGQLQRA